MILRWPRVNPGKTYSSPLGEFLLGRLHIWLWRHQNPGERPLPDCSNRCCRGRGYPHGHCKCGELTCSRRYRTDPKTLARRLHFVCQSCDFRGTPHLEQILRAERVRKDWSEVTEPVNTEAIVSNKMADQFPGKARQAIRAFLESDATRATVPDLPAGVLDAAISGLGLSAEMYAEQRSGTTVLRRVT